MPAMTGVLRKALAIGVVVAVVVTIVRALRGRAVPAFQDERALDVASPVTVAGPAPAAAPDWSGPAWIEGADGSVSDSHPVKAKLASGIYHLPGMMNYGRVKPDRWYRTAEDAEADGLRAAKR